MEIEETLTSLPIRTTNTEIPKWQLVVTVTGSQAELAWYQDKLPDNKKKVEK